MLFFYPHFCVFQDIFSEKVRGIGKLENDLYVVNIDCLLRTQEPQLKSHDVHVRIVSNNVTTTTPAASTSQRKDLSLLHNRLGHTPLTTLKKLSCFKYISTKFDATVVD